MEKATKQEMHEYLDEVAVAYNNKNRSVLRNKNGAQVKCLYFKEGTDGCAVGRRIEDKDLCQKFDARDSSGGMAVSSVYDELPESLHKFSHHFLSAIQGLHDGEVFWSEDGINEKGKSLVKEIKSNVDKNYYD